MQLVAFFAPESSDEGIAELPLDGLEVCTAVNVSFPRSSERAELLTGSKNASLSESVANHAGPPLRRVERRRAVLPIQRVQLCPLLEGCETVV